MALVDDRYLDVVPVAELVIPATGLIEQFEFHVASCQMRQVDLDTPVAGRLPFHRRHPVKRPEQLAARLQGIASVWVSCDSAR